MKTWITVLCAVALLCGCSGKKDPEVDAPKPVVEAPKVVVDREKLEFRDGLMYFEEKPFTGVGVRKHDNGQKSSEGTYKAGKMHGLQTGWHKNGQKRLEENFKDGKWHGLVTWWYENGQKKSETTFIDYEVISEKKWDKDGKRIR